MTADRVLRHIVMFKFKPETTADDIRAVEEAFVALPSKIETIIDFEWGTDVSVEGLSRGFTHCFVVTFKDEAGRDVYLPHPAHKEFVALVVQHRETNLVFDFWADRS
ncbi:MAG: Dabb family protein [Pseudomonadota bacterium]